MASDILIVDDEADIRELVAGILKDEGYDTRTAGDSDSALTAVEARRPGLIILDIWLQGSKLDGLELLDVIRERHPDVPVIIISGHGNIETAVSAIKKGAYDFIEKPFKTDRLVLVVRRAIEAYRLRRENDELRVRAGDDMSLVGVSPVIAHVRQILDKVAPTNSRILICGPAGSGKEVVARLLHARSRRSANAFIAINAANMAPERMEAELFGIEESSTGPRKVGVFEQAHGGTLFLDEVAEMPLETQSKILRVLVDQTFERVGGGPRVKVDVRVVSSSSRDLLQAIVASQFREDLYHRLNVVPVNVPPLSSRREDIPMLVEHFMAQISKATGLPPRRIADDAMAALQSHDWPGNVRQLRNNVERLLILASGDPTSVITADMLPSEVGSSAQMSVNGANGEHIMALPLREARETFEREYLVAQIGRFGGNISRTASFIGMERSALHRKLKSLGVTTAADSTADMSRIAYVNGLYVRHAEASVHIEDRGYQFSDGVYEVFAARNGQLLDEELHFERLQRSLKELRIALPMPVTALKHVLREVFRRNRLKNGIVYLQVTRGVAPRDHAFPSASVRPALVVTARRLNEAKLVKSLAGGVAVITTPDLRWLRRDIKSVSLLPNILAKQEAKEAGAYEALLVDAQGFITEGSSSNVWILDGEGRLVTRSAGNEILNGITRRVLLQVAAAQGLKIVEKAFSVAEAKAAREVFLSSSSAIVMPVVEIDGVPVGNGAPGMIAAKLRQAYLEAELIQ